MQYLEYVKLEQILVISAHVFPLQGIHQIKLDILHSFGILQEVQDFLNDFEEVKARLIF